MICVGKTDPVAGRQREGGSTRSGPSQGEHIATVCPHPAPEEAREPTRLLPRALCSTVNGFHTILTLRLQHSSARRSRRRIETMKHSSFQSFHDLERKKNIWFIYIFLVEYVGSAIRFSLLTMDRIYRHHVSFTKCLRPDVDVRCGERCFKIRMDSNILPEVGKE